MKITEWCHQVCRRAHFWVQIFSVQNQAEPQLATSCSVTRCWTTGPPRTPRTCTWQSSPGSRSSRQPCWSLTETSPPGVPEDETSWFVVHDPRGCSGRTRGHSCTTWRCRGPRAPCHRGSEDWPSPPGWPARVLPSLTSSHILRSLHLDQVNIDIILGKSLYWFNLHKYVLQINVVKMICMTSLYIECVVRDFLVFEVWIMWIM